MTDRDDVTDHDQPDGATEATRREGAGSQRSPRADAKPAAVEPARLARGALIGRYVVLGVVGEGGMGVVYAAYDPELDRKVAIKLLQATSVVGATGGQAWMLREAQAMARLSHPNVVAVHDVGSLDGDRVFVAMELVEGTTLRGWLRGIARTWREVLPVMIPAGAGLAAAHAAGLVHRDFKPDNVLVGNDGRVRVMDFGLARLRGDGHTDDDTDSGAARSSDLQIDSKSPLSANLTIAGTVVGTPAYMAPEIYLGHAADARTDQFAFGVALYEALFRGRPYDKHQLAKPAPDLRPKPPGDTDVPAAIQRVVLRAIAVDPAARYPSMDALLAELSIDPGARRRRFVVAAASIAVAAVIGGGVVMISRGHDRGQLCRGAERRLAGVWDDATRQAIRAAFLATNKPFAARAFDGLEQAVQRYATDWTATSVESCEATRVHGEQSEEVLSLRQVCLDQRLDELRAVTQLLAHADADVVEQGDKIAFGLEPVKRCSNVTLLLAPGLPPTEPKAKLAALRAKTAEAKADMIAGRYMATLVTTASALTLADELHYEPYRAEVLLIRGAALAGVTNLDDSQAAFAEAAWAAIRGHRDDVLARAALTAAGGAANALSRPGEAKIWLGLGAAAANRMGTDRALELQRYEVAGVVAAGEGDLIAAAAAHEKMLAAAEAAYGRDNPQMWADEEMYAATLAKAGNYAKAMPHFERALALRQRSVGDDHPEIALVLSSLGVCYANLGQTKQAKDAYGRSLTIREHAYGANSPQLVPTLNNIADMYRLAGDGAGALKLIERARAIAAKIPGTGHPMYHTIETTYAETLAALGRYADAHGAFDELLEIETRLRSPVLPTTQASRAALGVLERDWTSAAEFSELAISGFEQGGGKDSPELWRPLTSLGQARAALGQREAARVALERALAIGAQQRRPESDLAPAKAALSTLAGLVRPK